MRSRPGYFIFAGLFLLAAYFAYRARMAWVLFLCILGAVYTLIVALLNPETRP
jgi:hypothetical protein